MSVAALPSAYHFTLSRVSATMPRMNEGELAFVVAVVLIASTAQTVAGFGFALIAVPFLVTRLEVRDVVVFVGMLGVLNSAMVARTVWRHVPRRMVATMLAASFVGMPLGLAVLLFAPPDAIRLAVGVASIVMAAALMLGVEFGGRGVTGEAIAGVTSGVLNTSTGMNGPPIVLYLQHRSLQPPAFRGALSSFFVVSGIVSVTAFVLAGVVSGTAMAFAAVGVPAVFAGNALGARLFGRLSAETYRRLVLGLLVVTALVAVGTSIARIAG